MFVHRIIFEAKGFEKLKELIAELKKTEVIGHGFGHNNSRAYIIYATKDLSDLLRNKGFAFAVRQV